jgi:hypothetical protein
MFGFGKNAKNKKLAIDMMVIEYTNQGMLPNLAKIMAEKQIAGISQVFNNKMPFCMVISVMAWHIHIEALLELGDKQDEPLITSLKEMLLRYIKGLHKVYDDLDDYDKEVLSVVESSIRLNKEFVEESD